MKFLVFFISLLVFSVECVSQLKSLWGLEQWRHLMSWADQRSLPWGNVGHVASSDHDLSFCLVFFLGECTGMTFSTSPFMIILTIQVFYISVTVLLSSLSSSPSSSLSSSSSSSSFSFFGCYIVTVLSFFCWSSDHVYSECFVDYHSFAPLVVFMAQFPEFAVGPVGHIRWKSCRGS